jgi:hypothetical protein
MASFFEYATDLSTKVKSNVLAMAWSNTDPPILATSTKNGQIHFYLEEVPCFSLDSFEEEFIPLPRSRSLSFSQGEREGDVFINRSSSSAAGDASVLAWHPKYSILASGWTDGKNLSSARGRPVTVHLGFACRLCLYLDR